MKHINFLLLAILFSLFALGQGRNCPSIVDLTQMQIQDPARYQRFVDLENFTANYVANQGNPNQRLINPNGIIIIPVVVHVLHRGESEGTGRNISLAQIQSQIDVLNEDFRRLNADRVNTPAPFVPVASDYNFEFGLACQDPNGNTTNGVVRRQTNKNSFTYISLGGRPDENAMGIKMTNISGSDPWPTNNYLNIWVCDFGDGTLGYATFPADFATSPNVDGVVIDFTAFGRTGNVSPPFHLGRTATHEVGHWLNLRHINGDAKCGDDFVGDTPQQRVLNFGCPGFPHPSNCPGNGANGDMFMNYMDYTDDGCMNIYTNGQRLRGRAIFAPGGPRAAFLDNYFHFIPPNAAIRCSGNVKLFNPNCLSPITWNIVSGPATISGGQNTNEVTLQSTSDGIVTLNATAGNYITADININVNFLPPVAPLITNLNFDRFCGTFMEAYSNNPPSATGYIWDLNFGQVTQNSSSNYFYVNPLINSPQTGQSYYNYLSVQATNACGVSAPSETRQFTVGPVPSSCGQPGGTCETGCSNCCPILLRVSPNPSSDNMTVETTNNSTFMKLRVIDKMGNVKKEFNYPAHTKKVIIRLADLPANLYRLQATDGKNWTTVSFSKQ